jgi:hypothetical protein
MSARKDSTAKSGVSGAGRISKLTVPFYLRFAIGHTVLGTVLAALFADELAV